MICLGGSKEMEKSIYEVSLIIPIYNAANYINQTLTCVINQTIFNQMEIILVNDGSKDESKEICEKYTRKYPNILLINQDNKGVSEARNTGLKRVTGNYITFLDADDYVESDLYEKELSLIKKSNADIAVIDFKKVHRDGRNVKYRRDFIKCWSENQEILKDFFSGIIGNQVVDKLFSKSVIENLTFSNKYKIGEDMLFMYKALKRASVVVMDSSICGYYYVVREDSAMTGRFGIQHFDPVIISKIIYDECKENRILGKYAEAHLIHETCKSLEYTFRHRAEQDYVDSVKEMLNFIRRYKIRDARQYLIKRQFYGYMLMRLSPKLYLVVHKIMQVG